MALVRDLIPIAKPKKIEKEETPKTRSKVWQFVTISLSSFVILGSLFGPQIYTNFQFAYSKTKLFRVLKPGKYLVLFQNNTEIRPTGGFIGSFATIDWDGGIKNIYFDTNIYKRDKKYKEENKVISPKILSDQFGNNFLPLRDSNWDLDFRKASQTIQDIYLAEGGEKVDGVIALNATTFQDALDILGPIKMPKYNLELTRQNFLTEIQYKVEKEYWQDEKNLEINEPKTILKDLMPILLNRIVTYPDKKVISKYILEELQKKNIMVSHNDPGVQNIIDELNWSGAIRKASNDYLFINRANLNGGKSSANVKYSYYYNVERQEGKILSHLTILKHHAGSNNWPDGPNHEYVRVLVPIGANPVSLLINDLDATDQIDKDNYANYSQFGFMSTIQPGETQKIDLTYELPNLNLNNYSLLLQKQSGAEDSQINVRVETKDLFSGLLDKDLFIQ